MLVMENADNFRVRSMIPPSTLSRLTYGNARIVFTHAIFHFSVGLPGVFPSGIRPPPYVINRPPPSPHEGWASYMVGCRLQEKG